MDPTSVERAMAGCRVVYHAAGLPEQWLPDATTFERVNVGGTRTMIAAALAAGVERFVYTSTIDVFAWTPGTPFDESTIDPHPKGTAYERSKQAADRLAEARPVGSRYILSESTWTLVELARAVAAAAGRGRVPRVMPSWAAHGLATVGELIAGVIRRPPLIPRGQLHFLESGADPRANRARADLGWAPTSFREALPATLAFVTRLRDRTTE